jgi:hypothetical protein
MSTLPKKDVQMVNRFGICWLIIDWFSITVLTIVFFIVSVLSIVFSMDIDVLSPLNKAFLSKHIWWQSILLLIRATTFSFAYEVSRFSYENHMLV